HDLPQGLARIPRPDRPGGRGRRLARVRRPSNRPQALAFRTRRPALGVDPRPGRAGPGHPGHLRQPVWRDPDDDPGARAQDGRRVRRPEQHLRRAAWPAGAGRGRSRRGPGLDHPPPPARFEIVAFYAPLGSRGLVFRLGTMIISVTGGLSYWWLTRR